jgi:hypothetical protein
VLKRLRIRPDRSAAFELESRRYLVLLSEKTLPIENLEIPDGSLTYEIVNIAVSPETHPKFRSLRNLLPRLAIVLNLEPHGPVAL